jgi:hypothetical protein
MKLLSPIQKGPGLTDIITIACAFGSILATLLVGVPALVIAYKTYRQGEDKRVTVGSSIVLRRQEQQAFPQLPMIQDHASAVQIPQFGQAGNPGFIPNNGREQLEPLGQSDRMSAAMCTRNPSVPSGPG